MKLSKLEKGRYKMMLDTAGKRGGALYSGNVYSLETGFGDKLVKKGRAVKYSKETAGRVVRVDGVEMSWGDYLKRRKRMLKK